MPSKQHRRRQLGTYRWRWTPDQIAFLGTDLDSRVASRLRRTTRAVESKRLALRIPAHTSHTRLWSPAEVAMLGKVPDGHVARLLGLARRTVWMERKRLGIPRFKK